MIVLFNKANSTALVQSQSNNSTGSPSAAFGHGNSALANYSSAIGVNNVARKNDSSAIGVKNLAGWVTQNNLYQLEDYLDLSYLTPTLKVDKQYINLHFKGIDVKQMVAMGVYNMAFGKQSVALGNSNITLGIQALAVGKSNLVLGSFSNVIGNLNSVLGDYSSVLGFQNAIQNSVSYSFAFGYKNNIKSSNSLSLGMNNTIQAENSITIGNSNNVLGNKSIVIGNNIISSSEYNSIILGNDSEGVEAEELPQTVKVEFGNMDEHLIISNDWNGFSRRQSGSLSVGARKKERQIKNVAIGAVTSESTDAVNGSQLYSSIKAIGELSKSYSIGFSGDNKKVIKKKIGESLFILGGATDNLSDRNVGVVVEGNNINIKLSKQIKEISSVVTSGGTIFSDEQITLGQNGPSISPRGIDAKNKSVSNVLTVEDPLDTDGANVGFVKTRLDILREQGFTFMDDRNRLQKFNIGSLIKVKGDKNITTTISNSEVNIQLKSQLSDIQSVVVEDGPTLNSEGLTFLNGTKLTSDKFQLGNVLINNNGKITGVSDPTDETDATNKRYVDSKFTDLGNKPITLGTNDGKQSKKLGETISVKGADTNINKELFDGGDNVMTWTDQGNIRIGIKKDLSLSTITAKNENGKSAVLKSDALVFINVDDKVGADGRVKLEVTTNGASDVDDQTSTRIKLNQIDIANLNDGLKFATNSGETVSAKLNSKVNIIGQKSNNDWTKFDQGKNIMTNIEQKNGDTDITIALKRDVELDSATFGHGPAQTEGENTSQEGKDGRINLVNKDGKTTIQINAGNTKNQNGPAISINKPNSEEGIKLTSEGVEITKGPRDRASSKTTKTVVSIAPEGTARIEQDQSQTRPRLTIRSGYGESAITEEIATMNDGLRFKGDGEDLINKSLSSTLSIVGGQTDETKLTSTNEDKNIGVIVKDVANSGSRAPKDKVMQVRLAKKLKGLQSAEFKPVDDKGNPTGQTITVDSDGVSVAKEGKKSQFNEEGLKVGEDGPSVTDKGISAGGLSIANVGNPMKPHHASTKGYVDTEVKHLKNKINERYKDALGASAMAMATALLPPPNTPGKGAFSVAGAVVAGQPAFAMGVSTVSENNRLILRGAVSSDVRGQIGGGVGASYQW